MSMESLERLLEPIDFAVAARRMVADVDELVDVLRGAGHGRARVRLVGTASRQGRLPAPATAGPPVEVVSLARLQRITRLEVDDMTCSVEPGVRVADLIRELEPHRVRLPVEDRSGTIGGLFAAGDDLPTAPGAPSTRHLLLGLSGVLAEGLRFKSGSRVVKNVAGFDLQKLFVGSRGRFFAATELHLKLRPMPRRIAHFRLEPLDRVEALERFRRLRRDSFPPAMVRLESREGQAIALLGRYEGDPKVVEDRLHRHRLEELPELDLDAAPTETGVEELVGVVRPSRIAALLDFMPRNVVRWSIGGTGRLVIVAARNLADELVARLPEAAEATVELQRSPQPTRRGLATPRDPGAERLTRELTTALDPESILT